MGFELVDVSYFNTGDIAGLPKGTIPIIRSNDGMFRDPDFAPRYKACQQRVAKGDSVCFGVYWVYPGSAADVTWQQAVATLTDLVGRPDGRCFFMNDVESWGKYSNDRSASIHAARNRLRRWLVSFDSKYRRASNAIVGKREYRRLVTYGNVGDLKTLARSISGRLVVADYDSGTSDAWVQSQFPGRVIARQYTSTGRKPGFVGNVDVSRPFQVPFISRMFKGSPDLVWALQVGCVSRREYLRLRRH